MWIGAPLPALQLNTCQHTAGVTGSWQVLNVEAPQCPLPVRVLVRNKTLCVRSLPTRGGNRTKSQPSPHCLAHHVVQTFMLDPSSSTTGM